MLVEEARWFGGRLAALAPGAVSPMLNVGSHTGQFRTQDQPWIEGEVFGPARGRGVVVSHLDIRVAPGVDLVGDLTEPAFRARLATMTFRSAFCANLLEHVHDPQDIARAIVDVVAPGGYLFVSCPYRFPYHPDPIDTMYRPDPGTLAAIFPGTVIRAGAIVKGGTLLGYVLARASANPRAVLRTLVRRAARPSDPEGALSALHALPWTFRRFYETCLVLQRE